MTRWDDTVEETQETGGGTSVKILVAVASKHGGTEGIAVAIAQELRKAGHAVDLQNVGQVSSVGGYDAAIVGSAIYMGKWLREARQFVDHNRDMLSRMPVWLFSSGPLGPANPKPSVDPAHLEEMLVATRARGHRIFVGDLDRSALGLGERLIVKLVRAPEGDFREWDLIRDWAREIAAALATAPVPVH
jgi:menaquinone-dependent protoporphyrinogen oxidase